MFENKKRLDEADVRLKQQQIMYEQVRSERNLHSKNLIEAQVRRGLTSYMIYIIFWYMPV